MCLDRMGQIRKIQLICRQFTPLFSTMSLQRILLQQINRVTRCSIRFAKLVCDDETDRSVTGHLCVTKLFLYLLLDVNLGRNIFWFFQNGGRLAGKVGCFLAGNVLAENRLPGSFFLQNRGCIYLIIIGLLSFLFDT